MKICTIGLQLNYVVVVFTACVLIGTPSSRAEGCSQYPSWQWYTSCTWNGQPCVEIHYEFAQGCISAPQGNGCFWRYFNPPRDGYYRRVYNGVCFRSGTQWYCLGTWVESTVTYMGEYYWNECWLTKLF